MATIKFGAIVTDMRGKLGGHCFQKGNQSSVLRTNVQSRKVISPLNLVSQKKVNAAIALYETLSYANKQLWQSVAISYHFKNRFGDSITYTGRQLFLFLNNNLANAGLTAVTSPSGLQPKVNVPNFASLTFNTATSMASSVGATAPSGSRYIYKLQKLGKGQVAPDPNKYLWMKNTSSTQFTSAIVYEDYVARWGVPLTTDIIYCSLRLINASGFRSYSVVRQVTVT